MTRGAPLSHTKCAGIPFYEAINKVNGTPAAHDMSILPKTPRTSSVRRMKPRGSSLVLILLSSCTPLAKSFVVGATSAICRSRSTKQSTPTAAYFCSTGSCYPAARILSLSSTGQSITPPPKDCDVSASWHSAGRYPAGDGRRRSLGTVASSTSATAVESDDTRSEYEGSPGRSLAPHEPRIRDFEEWATKAGCRGKSVDHAVDQALTHADFEGLRGLMTKDTVEPWKPLATVPAPLLLEEFASGSASMCPPAPLSVKAWQGCPWWVRLGVRLLAEMTAGEDSRLRQYVQILPEKGGFGTPLSWPVEHLERLHYPRLLSQVKLQKRLFRGYQRLLVADATAQSTSEEVDSALTVALADSSCFDWALESVLSRAFQLPPDTASALVIEGEDDIPVRAPEVEPSAPETTRMALLPFIDSMNHYSRIPTHMYWETDGAISLSVGAQLDPGDHAFLSYGPVSNDDLLQFYGFVERENPFDTYVLQDVGKWLQEDGLLGNGLSTKLLACPGTEARETWRYLRRGVILRDAVHPTTMKALRVVCCERSEDSTTSTPSPDGTSSTDSPLSKPWDGTQADLARFSSPVSLASEMLALELLMKYCAREADAWGEAGVAPAFAEDPTAPGLDGDLDGLGLDADRRLMLSVFRQEKLLLLRGVVSRLTHMRKVSSLLNRPIRMPAVVSPPPVLGAPDFRTSSSIPAV